MQTFINSYSYVILIIMTNKEFDYKLVSASAGRVAFILKHEGSKLLRSLIATIDASPDLIISNLIELDELGLLTSEKDPVGAIVYSLS